MDIESNLLAVRTRIAHACRAADRPEPSVRLLAVSKTFSADAVRQAHAAGLMEFGENYIQEGVGKIQQLSDLPLTWHCIGPVQSNKARWVAQYFDWVHSIDRSKIAERLASHRRPDQAPLQVCLQVNVDGAASKSGADPGDIMALASEVMQLPGLTLRGLMSLPNPVEGFAQQVQVHRQVAALFDAVKQTLHPPGWDTLSLGMSADLESAIAAGSTLVRVGTALFGQR